MTTAHGVVANRPFQPTSIFAPDDTPIYVWYRAEGCVIGSVIKSSWFFLGTTPPVKFTEGAVIVDRDDDWGQFNFQLPPGRRWAAGDYRIELRVNDVLLSQVVFRVSTSVLSDIR